jgi:hypothetical protein
MEAQCWINIHPELVRGGQVDYSLLPKDGVG